jgi:CRISPR/Cas system-associated exonuclease Cas4 (RecB family)
MNSTPLEQHLLNLVKETIIADASRGNRDQSIHVTQLNRGCLRQTWYEINTTKPELDYEKAAIFRLGHMVHAGLVLSDENEVHLGANVRTLENIKTKDIKKAGKFFDCITGTSDDIMKINGEIIIVDKKTTNGVPSQLSGDYAEQLNMYKLLYFVKTGIDVKKGAIIYLNKIDSFKTIGVFEVELDSIENIQKRVISKLDLIKYEIPEKVISKRCLWCPYQDTVCHPQEDPNYTELIKVWK